MAIGEGFNAVAVDRRAIEGQGSSNYFNALNANRAERGMAIDAENRRDEMAYRYDIMDQQERDREERMAESRRQQAEYERRDARDYSANQSRYFDSLSDRKDERLFRDKQFALTTQEAGYRKSDYDERRSDKLNVSAQKAADIQSEYEEKLQKMLDDATQVRGQISYLSKVAAKSPENFEKAQVRIATEEAKLKFLTPETLQERYLRKHPDLGYDAQDGFFSRIVREKTPNPDPTDPSSGEMDWDKFDNGMASQRRELTPAPTATTLKPAEIIRYTADGKKAAFDAKTKSFIRYVD